jgi:O-antigen/teichoic acid export membrane protein
MNYHKQHLSGYIERISGSSIASIAGIFVIPLIGWLLGPEAVAIYNLVLYYAGVFAFFYIFKFDVIFADTSRNYLNSFFVFTSIYFLLVSIFLCVVIFILFKLGELSAKDFILYISATLSAAFLSISTNAQNRIHTERLFLISGLSDLYSKIIVAIGVLMGYLYDISHIAFYASLPIIMYLFKSSYLIYKSNDSISSINFSKYKKIKKSCKTFFSDHLVVKNTFFLNLSSGILAFTGIAQLETVLKFSSMADLGVYLMSTVIIYGPISIVSKSVGDVFIQHYQAGKGVFGSIVKDYYLIIALSFFVGFCLIVLFWTLPDEMDLLYFGKEWGSLIEITRVLVLTTPVMIASSAFERIPIITGAVYFAPFYNLLRLLIFTVFYFISNDMILHDVVYFFSAVNIIFYFCVIIYCKRFIKRAGF